MTLTELLGELPSHERGELSRRLGVLHQASGLAKQMVDNLFAETRPDRAPWRDIATSVLSAPGDLGGLKLALTHAARRHILRGGGTKAPWPALVGRAVTYHAFCERLMAEGFAHTMERAQYWTARLARESAPEVRRRLGGTRMGKHLMWATFGPGGGTSDPFGAIGPSADAIRAHLGLDQSDRGKRLVLLTYALPPGVVPCFPTVADAAAGDVWLWYFRPAAPTEGHGWTMPWKETLPPAPEVVHAPVTGATLQAAPRIVR